MQISCGDCFVKKCSFPRIFTKMAVHFTENKANANLAAIKTPFLIEDILDRNSIKTAANGNKVNFKMHPENVSIQNARNGNSGGGVVDAGSESLNNNQSDKNQRNNNEMPVNDDEYRKLLQNERYDLFE